MEYVLEIHYHVFLSNLFFYISYTKIRLQKSLKPKQIWYFLTGACEPGLSFGLFWNCLPEIKWFGHLAIFGLFWILV